jgi:hypothetical protein
MITATIVMSIFDPEGPPAPSPTPDDVSPSEAAGRGGPLWYLREAARIARFDHRAIIRTSQDRRALFYGACVMAVGVLAGLLSGAAFSVRRPQTPPAPVPVVLLAFVAIPLQLLASAINIAIIHGAARLLFGATGRYGAILRVLWLGSIVQWLVVVPVVGVLVGGTWFFLITLVTFEEVDGVERLQALMLVATFLLLTVLFMILFT